MAKHTAGASEEVIRTLNKDKHVRSDASNLVDVCIIGAGWSGLLACKYALENQLSVVVLEQRDNLGGIWNYTDDPNIVTVMDSTITSSSATVTEAADFPMKDEYGNFVHRKDIQSYLENYVTHFDLHRHIHFNQTVERVEKRDQWVIHCQNTHYNSRFLVICSGLHQLKRENIQEVQGYSGDATHIGDIKSIPTNRYGEHDHVLVYGGGESASDVVELLAKTPSRITWAIPNGQHFFRKAAIADRPSPGSVHQMNAPLDEASSKCIQYFAPMAKSKPGMRWLCNLGSTGSVLGYEGHGIPEWKKDMPFMRAAVNKNGHAVEYVYTKRVAPQSNILFCKGKEITFQDGRADYFTHLILCTGYESHFPYLPSPYNQKPLQERYKLIFEPEEPSLLFIGVIRPTVSSIPLMTEIQCMYAFRVLSGKVELPSREKMLKEIKTDIEYRNNFFKNRQRPDNLVCPFQYGYHIAELAGVNPNLGCPKTPFLNSLPSFGPGHIH